MVSPASRLRVEARSERKKLPDGDYNDAFRLRDERDDDREIPPLCGHSNPRRPDRVHGFE